MPFDENLVLDMPFMNSPDAAIAGAVRDFSGYGNHGAPEAFTGDDSEFVDGHLGQAINFSPARQLRVANTASIQFLTGTMSVWFRTIAPGAAFRGLITKSNAYGLYLNANELGFYDFAGVAWRGSGVSPTDDNWHEAVFTINNGVANGSSIYLDGIFLFQGITTIANQTIDMFIGSGGAGQEITAGINRARVWNRLLGAAEIYNRFQNSRRV